MRVSKEKSAENRIALLQAASTLFRQKGVDGVGVAEVASLAGLTHGALYAHFPSKEALIAEAFSFGFDRNVEKFQASAPAEPRIFEDYLDDLFSIGVRDNLGAGCPMTASASEIARQGSDASSRFANAFEHVVSSLEETLETALPPSDRRRLAVAAATAQIGAIVVSRAVAKANDELSREVLDSTRAAIVAARRWKPS